MSWGSFLKARDKSAARSFGNEHNTTKLRALHSRTAGQRPLARYDAIIYSVCSSSFVIMALLTSPPVWTGSYTCPALRPYQLGQMRVPECNHKVTGSGYKVVVGYEAETSTKSTGNV